MFVLELKIERGYMPSHMDIRQIASGFQQSSILLSAVELGLFEVIGKVAKSSATLARACNADLRAITCLLDALSAMRLLSKRGSSYRISKDYLPLLHDGSPGSILPILRHNVNMRQRWMGLTEVVKRGHPVKSPILRVRTKNEIDSFIGAMHAIGRHTAGEVAGICRIAARSKRMLDIGGASGTYTMAFLDRYKGLKSTIFDLPEVIPLAKKQIKGTRYERRVDFVSGDFETTSLPTGYDLALLSAIIHQNSRVENRRLYKKIYRSLVKGGHLIIRDHVMNEDRTSPVLGAIFAINMLVATKGGGTFTFKEISEDLRGAGFLNIKLIHKGDFMDCVVQAERK